MKTEKIEKAAQFARLAHDSIGQKRKYTSQPYWVHTQEVAAITASVERSTEDMVCAAHLHDVIEDVFPVNPIFNRQEIKNLFGQSVIDLVEALTDRFSKEAYPHFNRSQRKDLELKRLSNIAPEAMTIKLADIISNTKDIAQHGGDFAPVYLKEKARMLPFLVWGDSVLWKVASKQVEAALKNA